MSTAGVAYRNSITDTGCVKATADIGKQSKCIECPYYACLEDLSEEAAERVRSSFRSSPSRAEIKRLKNIEYLRRYRAEMTPAGKEMAKIRRRAYYLANLEYRKAYNRRYYQAHAKQINPARKQYSIAYYHAHKDEYCAAARAKYHADIVKSREHKLAYYYVRMAKKEALMMMYLITEVTK